MRQDLYDELKDKNIKISTAINLLIEEFLRESNEEEISQVQE